MYSAELPVQPAEGPLEQREQRDAGDDLGRDQREIQRAGERARVAFPQAVGAERADDGGEDGGPERDDDAVPGAFDDLRIAEDGAVPVEREVLPAVKREELKLKTASVSSGRCRNAKKATA